MTIDERGSPLASLGTLAGEAELLVGRY